jgi:hypothetical protein
MLLKSSFDSNGKFQLPLLYSSWVTPAEGKMGCNADFLSALKVANYFKGRGHGIELQLSHQNSEYIAR